MSGAAATVERLAELIRDSQCTVALTGAGISVPSGIPDFRSPGTGLWENVDPMEVAHIDVFRRDPKRFWRYYRPRFGMLTDKQPNPAHAALAELESRGLLDAVVTQNIDRLHRKAGSRRVIEVHGTIETSSLPRLRRVVRARAWSPSCSTTRASRAAGAPGRSSRTSCSSASCCRSGRWTRPWPWPRAPSCCSAWDRRSRCTRSPACRSITRSSGGSVAIVTKGPTPYDAEAEVRLEGDVVTELESVLAALQDL